MEATQLHLARNRFPIVGTLFGIVLLAWWLFSKNKSLEHAGLHGFVALAALALPAFLSGDGALHYVEEFPGASLGYLEEHEELGKNAFNRMLLVGAAVMSAYVMSLASKRKAAFNTAALVVPMLGITGSHGGQIMHKDLRQSGHSHLESQDKHEEHYEKH